MKKLYIYIFAFMFVNMAVLAQNNPAVVIRLKNGKVLQGNLQTENNTAAVLTVNSSKLHTVAWDDVALISTKHAHDSLQAKNAIELIEPKKTEEEKATEMNQPIMITVVAILAYMILSIGK